MFNELLRVARAAIVLMPGCAECFRSCGVPIGKCPVTGHLDGQSGLEGQVNG